MLLILAFKGGIVIDFKIREAIAMNVAGESAQEFTNIVEDAIASGEEHLLPGLGVFLERWWTHASKDEQQHFANKLAEQYRVN